METPPDAPGPKTTDGPIEHMSAPPWYGNIAIASALVAVPMLTGLGLFKADLGQIAAANPPVRQISAPSPLPTPLSKTDKSIEQARLRLTPI